MSRLRFLSASLGLTVFLFVPLSRVSGQECFTENFDGPGFMMNEVLPVTNDLNSPVTWKVVCQPDNEIKKPTLKQGLHPGWTGNAVQGSTISQDNILSREVYYAKVPGMKVGALSGTITLKARCWIDREKSSAVGIGFSTDPALGCTNQINFQYNDKTSGWSIDARTVGHGPWGTTGLNATNTTLGTFCEPEGVCPSPDVDMTLTLDFTDPDPQKWVIRGTVEEHDSGTPLVVIDKPHANNVAGPAGAGVIGQSGGVGGEQNHRLKIYNLNHVLFRLYANNEQSETPNAMDVDDVSVEISDGCASQGRENNCVDGIDADGDGQTDCADADCAALTICIPEDCDNGIDDNGDLNLDCTDNDCKTAEVCFCSDDEDNDGDTRTDCADADCAAQQICLAKIENCSDGIDNGDDVDADGTVRTPLVDCADPDCVAAPNCVNPNTVCYVQNFDVGVTPKQSVKVPPISWVGFRGQNCLVNDPDTDIFVRSKLHPNWVGNGLAARTRKEPGYLNPGNPSRSGHYVIQAPLKNAAGEDIMKVGAQSGVFTLRCRAYVPRRNAHFGMAFAHIDASGVCRESVTFSFTPSGDYQWGIDNRALHFGDGWYGCGAFGGEKDPCALVGAKNATDRDIDMELTIDFDSSRDCVDVNGNPLADSSECPGAEQDNRARVSARVYDHNDDPLTRVPLFEIIDGDRGTNGERNNKAYLFNSVRIWFQNGADGPWDYGPGVNVDDIMVICSKGPNGGSDHERYCEDGIDNDSDGGTDCDDSDCAGRTLCITEDCDDEEDNNENNRVDCADSDCANFEGCYCWDTRDNDNDGKTDCADSECSEICNTPIEICANGLDDDGDVARDCADSDCRAAPNCLNSDYCYAENFDVGTTTGQSFKAEPLNWIINPKCNQGEVADHKIVTGSHVGWQGNGIKGNNMTADRDAVRFIHKIPGMIPGKQRGVWVLKVRAFIDPYSAESVEVGFGTTESCVGGTGDDRVYISYSRDQAMRPTCHSPKYWHVYVPGVFWPFGNGAGQYPHCGDGGAGKWPTIMWDYSGHHGNPPRPPDIEPESVGLNRDVDIEISIVYDIDGDPSEGGYVQIRVLDHDTQDVLFDSIPKFASERPTLSPYRSLTKLSKINAIEIRQQHDRSIRFDGAPGSPNDGIDFDDITVTGDCDTTPESNCTDTLDNDNDGKTDCADSNCAAVASCKEAGNCADTKDNDVDGKIDCADSDCALDVACQVGGRFFRGDADDNGKLELTDALRVLGFLFLGNLPPTCLDAGDADDNGKLELTDALRILGFLFLGNAPPAPPGPPGPGNSCGVDTTPDNLGVDLGCLSYTKC